jgi:DNA ligase-1
MSSKAALPPYLIRGGVDTSSSKQKYAIFDVDGTLITPKRGAVIPLDRHDWTWTFPTVIDNIRATFLQGYKIVLRTDQSKEWRIAQLEDIITALQTPVLLLVAFSKEYKKPDTRLFTSVIHNLDQEESFMVGDAAGPPAWSDVDLQFAKQLGIRFRLPSDFFSHPLPHPKSTLAKETPEVVILVGVPASGKSTLVRDHFEPAGYSIYSGDRLQIRNPQKLLELVKADYLQGARRFVFDLTNRTRALRKNYIDFAIAHALPCRIVFVNVPLRIALARNRLRNESGESAVPDFAIYKIHKELEPPTSEEGCELLVIGEDLALSTSAGQVPRPGSAEAKAAKRKQVEDILDQWTYSPMLAENLEDLLQADPKYPIRGKYLQEKYDGVRAIWDGERFYTRYKNEIIVPEWYKRWFGKIPLDGEFFTRPQDFHHLSGIVRRKTPRDEDWKQVKFMAFDLFNFELPFKQRYPLLQRTVNQMCGLRIEEGSLPVECPIHVVPVTVLQSREQMEKIYEEILKKAGEGIILRDPESRYERNRRTKSLLKYKPVYEHDAEVMGYNLGTSGKYKGILGSLQVRWLHAPEVVFDVATGLKDGQRQRYEKEIPLGSIVRVEHLGLQASGRPREPRFAGVRAD